MEIPLSAQPPKWLISQSLNRYIWEHAGGYLVVQLQDPLLWQQARW